MPCILMQRLTDMVVDQSNPQVPTEGSAAMENDPAAASSSGEDVWDEERIEEALKVLKEMHIQVGSWKCLRVLKARA